MGKQNGFLDEQRLVTRLGWLLVFVTVPFIPVFLFFALSKALILAVISLVVFSSSVIASYFKLYKVSKYLIITGATSVLFIYFNFLEKYSGAYLILLPISTLALMLFKPKEKKSILILTFFPMICLILLELYKYDVINIYEFVDSIVLEKLHLIGLITTFLLLVGAMYIFFSLSWRQEKEIRQITRNLVKAVRHLEEKNKTLQKAYESLKESRSEASELSRQLAIEELSRQSAYATLTRGIAHEIKNPLQILSGRAYLVLEDLDDKEGVKKFAEVMTRNIERLTKLIHSMLQYGASSGRDKETFCLCEMVDDIAEFSKSSAKEKRITITSHWTESLQVCGNKVFIYQALLNLVVNAIQYTPLGGEITFTCTQKEGVDSSDSTRMGVEVAVSDTGIGISEENLKQIFVPYFTSKVQPENTGLGLSMAFKTFAENDGRLDVESTVGVGTTFRAWLPVVDS